jgi:DNA polymerase (family 10)
MHRLENVEIARIFSEIADLLEISDGNPFRVRSFRRVAEVVRTLPEHVSAMLESGSLARVPGIGEGSLGRIREILETGTCSDHTELREAHPPGLLEMLRIEGMGPKTVKMVHRELGICSVDELEAAARAGHLAGLPRMGEKSQAKLLKAIAAHRQRSGRVLLGKALPVGLALLERLRAVPGVEQAELAGSCRRRVETVGDLDVLVAADESRAAMEAFVTAPEVLEVMLRGETKCSVRLTSGLQADLRVLSPGCFGAALHYFTGSKMHNIAIRDRGKRRGLRISEYGVFREADDTLLGGATEEEVFAAVGLPFIPPELRENQGEIEAAEEGRLPRLVQPADLRGDLHVHSNWTDGNASIEEMAEAARALGYQYLAITDHSRSLAMAGGLDEVRLAEQRREVREVEQRLGGPGLLSGIEVDILPDGSLDLPAEALAPLDWVVASVHSHFTLSEREMTERILRALRTGLVDCLGHPSGRLLGQRDAYPVDLERLIREAGRLGVAMELNAFPDRLDLDPLRCRRAKELGVPVAINTDAHATWHLAQRDFGIATARRGWLEPGDVLNAGPLEVVTERRRARLRRHGLQVPAVPAQRPAAGNITKSRESTKSTKSTKGTKSTRSSPRPRKAPPRG